MLDAFLSLVVAKLSNQKKQSDFFVPPCIIYTTQWHQCIGDNQTVAIPTEKKQQSYVAYVSWHGRQRYCIGASWAFCRWVHSWLRLAKAVPHVSQIYDFSCTCRTWLTRLSRECAMWRHWLQVNVLSTARHPGHIIGKRSVNWMTSITHYR